MTALAARALGVTLGGIRVLNGVALALAPGTITAVVGANGAGKSTLLTCLAGLRRPDAGAVWLGGTPLLQMPPRERARRLAFLPQMPEIAWPLDVRTLVGLGRTPFTGARGLGAADHAAVERAMAAAGVTGFAARPVGTLSGGERGRVLIARALAGEPEWLLADEPMTGLDPGHQLDMAALFTQLAVAGTGIVITVHDLTLALRLAQRVVVLAGHSVRADDPVAAALTAAVVRDAYDVRAARLDGPGGPLIDVIGRV